jgi:hypothetical protein
VTPKIHSVFCSPHSRPASNEQTRLSLLGLGESLLDLETPLLLENHNLEPAEVGERPSLLGGINALGERRVLPLLGDTLLLPELGDDTGASTTGQRLEDDAGEADVGKRERLAGDGGIGGVNQDLRVSCISYRKLLAATFSAQRFDVPACGR